MNLLSSFVVRDSPRSMMVALVIVCASARVVFDAHEVQAGAATRRPNSEPPPAAAPVYTRAEDAIWMVSTRHLGAPGGTCGTESLIYQRWMCGRWQRATWRDFADSPALFTCLFVHGNRIEADEATPLGLDLYQRLTRPCDSSLPMRYVIWSWPSDRLAGPLRDAREKGQRAMVESVWLAQLLQNLPEESPVSLIGFSYGSRVILGATHLLGGGSVAGRRLPERSESRIRPHVVLAAAAVETNWLCPGGGLGLALPNISQLTLISNSHDLVLRHFNLATGRRNSQALGVTGLPRPLTPNGPLRQADFACELGRTHSWERHLERWDILELIRQGARW